MFGASCHAEAHSDLAVADLAQRAAVLTLYTDGVLALLRKASVVDDPAVDRLALGHRGQRVSSSFATNGLVIPRRISREVMKPLMFGIHALRVRARTRGDRLEALAFTLTEDPECVRRKAGSPF